MAGILEVNSALDFPLVALPTFIGTFRPSNCLYLLCVPLIHCPAYHVLTRYMEDADSPSVDTTSLYNMADLRPRGAAHILTNSIYSHIAFRYEQNVGTPVCTIFRG